MSIWVILTGRNSGLNNAETPHKIVTAAEYLSAPGLFRGIRPNIINLASSYAYQSRGYYASLLAGARGHRVIPSVETMIDLSERRLYENAVPELEDSLNRCLRADGGEIDEKVLIFFGTVADRRLDRFAKLLFDWFRAPALEVALTPGRWTSIRRIRLLPFQKLTGNERAVFLTALDKHTGRLWRESKPKTPARYSIATLVDTGEALPPSTVASLKHWARLAAKLGVDVSPITRRDLPKLANYDALFIRETTSISNHTYRFAKRAEQEGMPVIDDPVSMIRCTNKVYLHERLGAAGIAMPASRVVAGTADLEPAAKAIGFPMVLKIPDGSFSRGVSKVENMADLAALAGKWLKDSDLLIAQEFLPTEFDWRVGVLDGKPLFVTQYLMAKKHWQIIRHDSDGRALEGGFRSATIAEAPPDLISVATRAASLIGNGLYGVDVKQTADGFFVIEINDNPNLDHGVEDAGEKDAVWNQLTEWFIRRIDA